MKLNFWQWLGVVLLIVGIIVYVYTKRRPAESTTPGTSPVVQPTR